jgi:hypothetical protein
VPARRRQILLVAGPSGGGKSTFIRLLRAKQLSSQIAGSLPPEAESWPLVTANFRKSEPSEDSAPAGGPAHPSGLIVHYDTTFPHRHGIHNYEADPALQILEHADRLCIANVLPAHDQLVAQFDRRHQRRHGSKNLARKAWRHGVRIPFNRLRALLGGQRRETMDLYATPEWVRSSCEQWDAFVKSVMRGKPGSTVLQVEPWPDAQGHPNFRLHTSAGPAHALPVSASPVH